jgi:7,8-dihydro-6-hydroxymethylpterin-pyrophosphokinase
MLFYDDVHIDGALLTVPHPRINERRFVLTPLAEVAPERCPQNWDSMLPPSTIMPRGALFR